jgi:hypothetical protein
MSRRSINAARAAENPDWRNQIGADGAPVAIRRPLSLEEEVERLRDLVANLTRDKVSLEARLQDALRGTHARAPTQEEILAAISSAITNTGKTATPPSAPAKVRERRRVVAEG